MKKILIVGGYGDVGKHVVKVLLSHTKENLILAGRSKTKAEKFIQSHTNERLKYEQMDIYNTSNYEEKLMDISLVIMCLSPNSINFALYCLKQGIHYIDISPSNQTSNELLQAYCNAENKYATCVLGVGICPGLSTLLVKSLSKDFTKIESIDVNLLLGMGDEYGDDSIKWLLSNLQQPIIWKQQRETEYHRPFIKENVTDFQSNLGKRSAYAFNLADQQIINSTLQSDKVSTYFCYDVKIMTRLVHFLARVGLFKLIKYPMLYKLIKIIIQTSLKISKSYAADIFAIHAEINGYKNGEITTTSRTITGNNSSKSTGIVVAKTAIKLLNSDAIPGAFYLHELFDLESYEPIV